MALKFSQVTASLVAFTTGDVLLGVQSLTASGGNDRIFSLPQIASAILTSPNITGHATIEGVTLTGATGTGAIVFDHAPTIGTATINNATLGTATINNSTLGTATINNSTLATATINTATINNPTINTATINTSTLNAPTINSPILNNPVLNTATISTGTFSNVTINTATINNPVLNTATINTATLGNATLNTSTLNTSTINNATIATATVSSSTINNSTINTATINTSTINNSTIGTATINNSTLATSTLNTATLNNATLNTATINTATIVNATLSSSSINLLNTLSLSQIGSAVDTTSFTSRFNKYRISFENVCAVATSNNTNSLNMQMATSGTNWLATSTSYISNLLFCGSGTTSATAVTSTSLLITGNTFSSAIGTFPSYGVTGWIEIPNPSSSTFIKSIVGQVSFVAANGLFAQVFPSGGLNSTTAPITGIAISFQTGNIATGIIRIYGVI